MFQAGDKATTQTITATLDSGDDGKISFSVETPQYEVAEKLYEYGPTAHRVDDPTFQEGEQGVGMYLKPVTVCPLYVSFSNVEIHEIGGYPSKVEGYFTYYNDNAQNYLYHNPGIGWVLLGSKNNTADSAWFGGWPSLPDNPWSAGEYDWDITVQWHVAPVINPDSAGGDIPVNCLQQHIILGSSGRSEEAKFGQTAYRSPSL